jgi:Cft2 family RNA processing exonuclease
MIYAKVGDAAMVYTGDYNMTPDRHLGAAQIDRLKLDVLITEYGLTSNYKHFCFAVAFTWIFNLVLL